MFSAKQSAIQPYASAADFCRIFERETNGLYLLSYLLTGDAGMAEECFQRSLQDVTGNNRVFRDWAESWTRRTIMHNAIQMLRLRPSSVEATGTRVSPDPNQPAPIRGVIALPAFERFVFVMSVLERQSIRDCALLLGCTRDEVVTARERALRQMGQTAEPSLESKLTRTSEPSARQQKNMLVPALVVSA